MFVHGLGGSATGTWRKMIKLMERDAGFNGWTIDCYEYPTRHWNLPWLASPPGLRELAEGLKTFLRDRYGDYARIDLVAHSLGGVVTRKFLVDQMCHEAPLPIRRVALIAVPNAGSELARIGRLISWNHHQLRTLTTKAEELSALDASWRELNIEASIAVRYLLGGVDRCVPRDSACPDPHADPEVLIDADHRNIISPRDLHDPRYTILAKFLLASDAHKVATIRAADPLFDIYSPEQEPFYIERTFDATLARAVSAGHAWLCGTSGVGKSAALRRAVYRNGWALSHVNLSGYQAKDPVGMMCALATELALLGSDRDVIVVQPTFEAACQSIRASLIKLCADQVRGVVVEEIPLEAAALPEFLIYLSKLFQVVNGVEGLSNRVIFAFSSVADLCGENVPIPGKVRDTVQLMGVPAWSMAEIEALVRLLATAEHRPLNEAEVATVVEAANGSPRFVKAVFKQYRNGMAGSAPLPVLLQRVAGEQL